MKSYARYAGELLIVGLLSGCSFSANTDMQGEDPRDYYAAHPIKNQIETRHHSIGVHFAAGQSKLSPDEIDKLSDSLHGISLMAIDSITITTAKADRLGEARNTSLTRLLRNMGYKKGNYTYDHSDAVKTGDAELSIAYAAVVAPDCPDWRTSPVTTHSNTKQGNFGCAHEVNLGLMVADPHDLVRGTEGEIPIDTVTAAKAIQDYHEGKTGAGASSSGSATAGSGGGSGTVGAGQ